MYKKKKSMVHPSRFKNSLIITWIISTCQPVSICANRPFHIHDCARIKSQRLCEGAHLESSGGPSPALTAKIQSWNYTL